jgi:hypothetical protein
MDIAVILTRKFEGALWELNGDDYTGLTWLSEGEPPTGEALSALA